MTSQRPQKQVPWQRLFNFIVFALPILILFPMKKKYLAELLGTFWLVFGGCGSAMLSAAFPHVGIGLLGVSLAFGLTVLTMAYAIGSVSGAHLNPAVSIGLWAAGRFSVSQLPGYILSQIAGALLAAALLFVVVTGNGSSIGDFAANGYGTHSPGGLQYTFGICNRARTDLLFSIDHLRFNAC